ncbi:pilus assembly protein [Micromonospora sp. DT81.3]|uniref:pilus assembly protein n=1 Tax=Micromonospora sp. DT81.3 TaxID=3416523 RepID=UPI003CF82CA5
MRTLRRLISRFGDDRGSSGLEIVILAPAFVAILVLLAAGGRLALAGNAVESAASAAAREASLARSSSSAQTAAEAMARTSMTQAGVNCQTLSVVIDSSGLNAPIGTTGTVGATVTCTVALNAAAMIGLPGTRDLTGAAISPVDAYRERR